MKKYAIITLLLVVSLGITVVFSQDKINEAEIGVFQDENIEAEIEVLLNENLRATEAEDMDAMLETMHTQSPAYEQTQMVASSLFPQYDLKFENKVYRYIGMDRDYAIARFEFCSKKVAGPDFKDNCLDTFHIFKKEDGNWKIWSQAILKIEFINQQE